MRTVWTFCCRFNKCHQTTDRDDGLCIQCFTVDCLKQKLGEVRNRIQVLTMALRVMEESNQ